MVGKQGCRRMLQQNKYNKTARQVRNHPLDNQEMGGRAKQRKEKGQLK